MSNLNELFFQFLKLQTLSAETKTIFFVVLNLLDLSCVEGKKINYPANKVPAGAPQLTRTLFLSSGEFMDKIYNFQKRPWVQKKAGRWDIFLARNKGEERRCDSLIDQRDIINMSDDI